MFNFDFSADYVLEDSRVRLLPLLVEHAEALLSAADHEAVWYHLLENGRDVQQLTAYIAAAVEERSAGKAYAFAVFDKAANLFAGTTRFYEINPELQTIKLGHTWYGRSFWGSGLNKHCKYLLFDFAFEAVGAWRVGFGVSAENIRSLHAMRSVGCTEEGRLREYLWSVTGTGRTDVVHLSMLRSEWRNGGKAALRQKLNT
ncbi:MAG: GNAT family protein [Bacteroidota bacterium]